MQQLSSRLTIFTKHVLPWILLTLYLLLPLILAAAGQIPVNGGFAVAAVGLMMLAGPICFFVFRFMFRKVVDEVWLDADSLVIRNAGREYRVPLRNCINVSCSSHTSPPLITVTLREPCESGDELVFAAPIFLNPFAIHPVAKTLIGRIDDARPTAR